MRFDARTNPHADRVVPEGTRADDLAVDVARAALVGVLIETDAAGDQRP